MTIEEILYEAGLRINNSISDPQILACRSPNGLHCGETQRRLSAACRNCPTIGRPYQGIRRVR